MIYLDNSATTRPFDSVIDAMDRCMRENYFNASAAYKPAVDVDRAMRECRRAIAAQLGIQESGVIFTGGGTESDNLAILGVAETLRQSANFVCSAIEHPAVAETIHRVEQMGHTVRVLPIDVRGVVDLAACETVIDEHTALVSCMQVSNETGAIQPVESWPSWRAGRTRTSACMWTACRALCACPCIWNAWAWTCMRSAVTRFTGRRASACWRCVRAFG